MSEPVPGCSKPSAAMSRRSPGPAAGRWKLIFDPQLRNDHPHRVYRIGGRVANDAQGIYSAYNWDEDAKDPRIAVEDIFPVPFDLKVPVLKIDEYYPNPPEREISFFNLHPSISERQLAADCRKYGGISELKLYTHPKTHHQLGLARVIFKTVPAAKRCEMDRNEKPWHGRTVKCFYDMKGRVVRTAYELLVTGRMRSAAGASALIKAAIDAVIEQEKQRESLEAEERANAITKRGEGDFMNEEGYYPSVARTPSPSDMFGRLPRQKVAIPACAAEGHKMDRQAEPIVNAAELPLPPAPPPPSPPVVPVAPRAVDRPSTSSVNVSVNPLTEQNSPAPVDPCPIVLQKANAAAQNVAECSRAPENPRSRSRTDRRRSRSKKRKSKSRERSSSKRSKSKARGKSRSRKKSKSHRRRKYSDSGSSSSSDSSESRSRSRRKDRSKYDLPPASSKVDRKMAYSQKEYQKSRSPKKRSEKWTGNVDSHSERRHRRHKLVEEVKEERVKIVRTTKFEVSPLVDSSSGSVPSNVLSSPRVATGPRTPPSNSPQPPVKLPVNSPVPLKENEATLGECSGSTLSQRLNSLIAKNVPGYSLDNTAAVGTQAGSTPVDTSGSSKNAPEPVAATPPQFKPAHSSAVRQHGRGKPQDASGGQHGNYESYMAYWNQWNWAMQYHQMYPAMYAPPMPPTAVMGMAAPPPPHGMPFWAPGVPPPPVPPYVHNAAAGPAPPRAAAVVDKAAARQHAQPQFGRPREKRWEVGVAARPAVRDPRDQRVRQPAESDHALGKENFGDKAVAGSSGIVERVKVLAAAMSRVRKDIEMATLRSLKQRACTRVAHDAFDSIYDDQEAKYREELAVKAAATCKSLEEASPHKSASTQEADSTEVASTSKKPAENVADGATTGVSSTLAQLFGAGVSTSLHGMPGFGLRQALPKIRKKRVSSPVQQATKREDASPSSRPLSAHAPARPGSQLRALSVDRDSGSECDNDNVGDASRRRGARVLVDEDSEAEKKDTGGKLTGIDDIGKDAASSTADSDAATSQEEDSDAEATEADDNAAYNGLDASQVQSAASSDSGDSSDSDEVEQSDSENESGEETAVDGGSDAAENEKRDDAKMKESSKTTPGPAFNGSLATKSVDVLLGKIKENERESIPESHEPGPSMCVSEMERYEAWVHDHDYAFVAPGGSDAGGQQKDDWRARLALTLYSTAIHESSSKRKADRESLQSPPKKRPKKKASPVTVNKEFKPRSDDEQKRIVFGFTKNNFLDSEDMKYLERSFVALRSEFGASPTHWSLQAHWAPHAMPPLELNDAALGSGDAGMKSPGGRSRKSAAGKHGGSDILPPVHRTGCARSEGYYKLSAELKASLTRRADTSFARTELQSAQDVLTAKQQAQREKEARLLQRRLATAIGCEDIEDNNLKFRRKLLRFGRSRIHGWGLFALEDIVPDSMVIEYVGETLRSTVADARELRYMRQGMGSSYLFRIDDDTVIDATKKGAVARFINHSCNPSCYAKIITAGGSKRIVIYSRKHISKGEEITYDYKFPIEDDKIPCLCGAPGCRRWLN